VEYYANVITRRGLPEGVGRLTDEQFRHRNSTLMFIKRGRQGLVHEIRQVNSRGVYAPMFAQISLHPLSAVNPLQRKDHRGHSLELRETVRVSFELDTSAKLLNQSAYNRADRQLYTLEYDKKEPNFAMYKEGAFLVAVRESGITHIEFVRPEEGPESGLDKEVRFFGEGRAPQPNHDGAYGYRYSRDRRGLVTEAMPLSADGQPTVTRNGTARRTATYNALGQLTREVSIGRDGQPVLSDDGIAGGRPDYDQYGNVTEISFFGTEYQPVTTERLGAAIKRYKYDERGNLVEVSLYGPNGQLALGKMGIARQEVVWDAQGRTSETFFGPDDKPITVQRAVKLRGDWDERGYLVHMSFFDEHDRPLCNDRGCAKGKFTRDKHGNLAEYSCLDQADHFVRDTSGYAKVKLAYDERGNATEFAYFGPDGRPQVYEQSHVNVRVKYTPQGNPIERVFLDAKDQPIKTRNGYAKLTTTYGMHGRVLEETYWDEYSQPTPSKDGYAIIRKAYDTGGRLIEEILFGPEAKPARHDDGYVKRKYAYDHRGYLTERTYYDEHDRLTLHTDGYAKEQSKYNDRGQLLETAFVGPDGAFVLHKKRGYAKARWTYNQRGQVERLERFNPQDQLMQTINGYAVSRYVYDDYGRELQRVFLDLNGAPVHTRVAIRDIEPDRNSQQFGLQVGDLIIGYDGEEVRNTHVFDEFELVKGERPRELRLLHQGKFVSIDVPPGRLQGLELVDRVPPEAGKPGT
jgi:hypothetical protein